MTIEQFAQEAMPFEHSRHNNIKELMPFQLELLKAIDKFDMPLLLSSRQMGISSLLAIYIGYLASNGKKVSIVSNKVACAKEVFSATCRLRNLTPDMLNNITIRACTIDSFIDVEGTIVLDNAGFCRNLEDVLNAIRENEKVEKVVIASNAKRGSHFNRLTRTQGYDLLTSHYSLNHLYTNERLDFLRSAFHKSFAEEMECKIYDEEEKTHLIPTIRISDKLNKDLNEKLFELGISMSDYIRELIEHDLYKGK